MNNLLKKGNASELLPSEASFEKSQVAKKGTIVNNSTALVIAGTSVRQVGDFYSLNDLHKAAGGEAKHRPNYFVENEQTKALIQEIQIAGIPAIEAKPRIGTYACKELVIAYAAWISAAFHLKVIRVFLAQMLPTSDVHNPAIDYDRISPAQAQDLKEIVQAIVDGKVQTYGETWRRLQNKFRVNSYLQLPSTLYEEARAYLIAKLPNGYASDLFEKEPEPQLIDLALVDSAMTAANAVAAQVQKEAFMAMVKHRQLDRCRFQLSIGYGSTGAPQVKPIDDASYIATIPQMARMIETPGAIQAESQDLMDLAKACMNRLSTCLEARALVA